MSWLEFRGRDDWHQMCGWWFDWIEGIEHLGLERTLPSLHWDSIPSCPVLNREPGRLLGRNDLVSRHIGGTVIGLVGGWMGG